MREKSIAIFVLLVLLNSCVTEQKVCVRSPFANPTAYDNTATEALRVPPSIYRVFVKAYPGAQQVNWHKELDDFTVDFVYQDQAYELCYDEQAQLIDQKNFIALQDLKPEIKSLIAQNHPQQKALKAYQPKGQNHDLLVVLLDDQSEAYYRISSPIKQETLVLK